ADAEMRLLLEGEVLLSGVPEAVLMFTCNGRGQRLFNLPHHDAALVQSQVGKIPLAGFFAAGEIGPVGGRNFVHGQTAALALLRSR
ncbi:MAG: FIST C-terminal domain-containing protein, partial [Phycisphaerae bacterium]